MHRQPTGVAEQVHFAGNKPAETSKVFDFALQRVGNVHVGAIPPHRAVAACRQVIVQDQEVADTLEFVHRDAVVFVDHQRVEMAIREQREKFGDPGLYQVNAGGFQRFQKAAGQPDGNHVLVPKAVSAPRREAQQARLGQRLAIEIRK